MRITRRELLIGSIASICALVAGRFFGLKAFSKPVQGSLLGASSSLGHKLRNGGFPAPSEFMEKDVVIVGGGIAGLAAGYRLMKEGQHDFILLDLEKQAGGNSAHGKNDVSSYPWGAHYVPLLTQEAGAVRKLFEELNIITGSDSKGFPIYNEYYICGDPHERLFMYGRWQDGLIPVMGISPDEDAQYKKFFSYIEGLKHRTGKDGKRLFAIPIDLSSQDQEWVALDGLTMKEWMDKQGYTSPHLRWYVDYGCRDDYGTTYTETSAWAGLHYFAARNGVAANTESSNVITWPEGNGWLVSKLIEPMQKNVLTDALAYNITDHREYVTVDYFDAKIGKSVQVKARTAIIATPHFIAARLLKSDHVSLSAEEFSYAPWAVANITLSELPFGKGASLSWDNVAYNSPMLGYVVATHQIPQMNPMKTVITYYWPLSHLPPAEARKEALERSYADWQSLILKELFHIHPDLEGKVEQLDVWVWGHAMVRPTRGFIWGKARKKALKQYPPIFTAHSDMSGISIFEEAYTHGVRAAENAMKHLNVPYRSVL
jgi:hypothetical protein